MEGFQSAIKLNNKVSKAPETTFDLKQSLRKIIRRVKLINEKHKQVTIEEETESEEDEENKEQESSSDSEADEEEMKDEP